MVKVAFFDTKPYDRKSFDSLNSKFNFKIKYFDNKLNEDTASLTKGYDVVCAFVNDNLNKETIELLYENGIKLIALRCAGFNNVDFKVAYDKIHIVRVPAYSPYAVAEHAFALLATLNRKTHKAYNRTRESNFSINGLTGFDLYGKTIGIIGMGKIGQIVANISLGFGMKVLAYDLFPKEREGVKYTSLDDIYKHSDIITLHCPLTSDTHHLINKESIKKMKTGVYIINTSRGGLVDTAALIKGIKSGKIGGGGLDVYEEEASYFFEDYSDEIITDDVLARLLSFNNVVVTSHQAFLTKEALYNIAETTLSNIKAFYDGEPLVNEICYQCQKKGKTCSGHTKKCF